jgi:predicted Rossmann-fold nucleotide-binding protein
MTPTFSLCVYCGSRPGADPAYAELARAVGLWIGHHAASWSTAAATTA